MKTTDLGNDWFANEMDDGSLTLRNGEIGMRIDLPEASVLRLKRIFVVAAMALVDKTLLAAYAEPMSADEIEARSRGWQGESEGLTYFAGSGVIHPAGRWASNWTQAIQVDVEPGWQAREAARVLPGDEIPF